MPARVLLSIEDSDTEFHLIQLAVKKAGAGVELYRVPNGEQGLAFLKKLTPYQDAPRPDLVLLNLNLPRMTGLEVLREIEADGSTRSIPVVVFTTSALAAERKKALALGAEDYITKPATLDGLFTAMEQICRRIEAGV